MRNEGRVQEAEQRTESALLNEEPFFEWHGTSESRDNTKIQSNFAQ
jgi:hypothetical protein